MKITASSLDRLRAAQQMVVDTLAEMAGEIVAGQAGTAVDSWAETGEDVRPDTSLAEAIECRDYLEPVEVTGWAPVARLWAVRLPIAGADGTVDDEEVETFATRAAAEAFIASHSTSAA